MLWDAIRDFFVQHVFGGTNSLGVSYFAFLGNNPNTGDTTYVCYNVGLNADDISQNAILGLDDWLSTTATIISISIIVVLCCLFVYKIIKLIGGLIR